MTGERSRGSSRRSFVETLGLLGATGFAGLTAATPGREPGPKEDEVLVGVEDNTEVAAMEAEVLSVMPDAATVAHRNQTLGYMAVEVPGLAEIDSFAALRQRIETKSGVAYVERNVTYETQVAPNDPEYDSQYAPQQVNAEAAWDSTFGSTDVTIAVIDTGAQYDHPDLSSLYASDPGRDFVDDDGDPYPDAGSSHGTHVSGCASADTDNGTGVAGVTDSTLLNARCLGGNGSGSLSDIADGIQWAVDAGADIVNMSLGGGSYTQTMKSAVEYAYDQNDALVICAAGNDSASQVSYPARYEECVAVSAVDPDENLASFSNYGAEVEVAAPGVNVLSTYPTDRYAQLSGTSMACPVAAGVAALGLAANPDLSAADLRQRLKDTAVDVGLSGEQQGAGRVDAANIVSGEDGGDGGGGGGGEEPTCITATNDEHVEAGRAYAEYSWWYGTNLYYAQGSDEYIGYQGGATTSLKEESAGVYVAVQGC